MLLLFLFDLQDDDYDPNDDGQDGQGDGNNGQELDGNNTNTDEIKTGDLKRILEDDDDTETVMEGQDYVGSVVKMLVMQYKIYQMIYQVIVVIITITMEQRQQ